MKLNKRENAYTGDILYSATHPSGLDIHIIPKPDYNGTYAIIGTRYGSIDSEFVVPGEKEAISVPDGIAHFLEHKMFDQPDGSNVFDKFSRYGGNANAFTTFNITAYLVSTTAHFEENLETLLDYVQSPYYTDETVEKEQGIIGQEIRMYDDSASWKMFFNYINCLFCEHPIKKEIAGTIESISNITADYLYKCYNTFYNLSNMSLVIVGKVDLEKTVEIIEKGIKNSNPFTEPIKKLYPNEPKEIAMPYFEQEMAIASPMFMMGFKDNDNGLMGDALLKKNLEITILMRMLFSKGTPIYEKLYSEGLINSTFSSDFTCETDYCFSSLDGESKDPKRVYEIVLNELDKIRDEGLCEEDYERAKRVVWGRYIRTHNDIEDYATTYLQYLVSGVDYYNIPEAYKSITFSDVKERFNKHFNREYSALSVIKPKN